MAIPDGAGKSVGIPLDEQVAASVHADRAADGTSVPDSADQFRPRPPPHLSSLIYARDYNETKNFGGAKSTARTAEQTEAVKFWRQANISPAWQEAARQISAAKGLGLAENAWLALPHSTQLMSHAPSTVTRYIAPSPLVQPS